jgi:hypothetical protein
MLGVGALGLAFLAKMMEACLVVPGFALVYLVAGPGGNLPLARFERYVRPGAIHYYVAGGGAGGGARQSDQAIASWVRAHYRAVNLGVETVYDLTRPRG